MPCTAAQSRAASDIKPVWRCASSPPSSRSEEVHIPPLRASELDAGFLDAARTLLA